VTLFVDTSVWFAAVNANDTQNKRAKSALVNQGTFVTSTLVLAESWRLIHQKLHWKAAESFWSVIRNGAAQVENVIAADFETAWQIGKRYPDQDFSLTDRTSFALMERLQIMEVATFDSDFAIYRMSGSKGGAFRLVG
jgi:uncharacterized protein